MNNIVEEIRTGFAAGDAARDEGLTTPEDILRADDLQYGPDPQWNLLDVYRPKAAQDDYLPVIISFHGGGWVYGTKEVYQFYCMSLAQRGFAVINFTYRLAPEHPYPAPLEDMNLVVNWMLENRDQFGFDTDRVFGVGDSAGGHGLGLYAALTVNPQYAAACGVTPPEGFRFSAVALNCGAYDMKKRDEALKQLYLPAGMDEKLLQVPAWVTDQYPPTYLMTANQDFLKDHAPMMQRALTKNQVPFVLACYGDKDYPLSHVFHCNMKEEMAHLCNDEECAFFGRYI